MAVSFGDFAFDPERRQLLRLGEPVPLETLLAKLRGHTNSRAVADPASPSGDKLEPGPFPGWANPPEC
jgi:hypothetical protein